MSESNIYEAMQQHLGGDLKKVGAALADRRIVPLHGKINSEGASKLFHTLVSLELKEVAPITLLIDSSGGDVDAGEMIIEGINMIHSPVIGMVMGDAGSMAIDVLFSCKQRIGLPRSKYFLHFSRRGFEIICSDEVMKQSALRTMAIKVRQGKSRHEKMYAERMGRPLREVRELLRLGESLHIEYRAEEAIKLGIIDEIKTDFKLFPKPQDKATSS